MKKILVLLPMLMIGLITWACPACEKQQPKILRGITHGVGPSSNWDLVIVMITAVIVLATLFFTIKWIVKPGEKEPSHIKRTILNFN
ncbi:MAG: DUF6019 family protein [Ginsengibacter sp.]|jgi:uncharacterized protein HemY